MDDRFHDFVRAITRSRGDKTPLGAFADYLDEQGHPLAPLVRHLFEHGGTNYGPFRDGDAIRVWHEYPHQWGHRREEFPQQSFYGHDAKGMWSNLGLRFEPLSDRPEHRVSVDFHYPTKKKFTLPETYFAYAPPELTHAVAKGLAELHPDSDAVPFYGHLKRATEAAGKPSRYARELNSLYIGSTKAYFDFIDSKRVVVNTYT